MFRMILPSLLVLTASASTPVPSGAAGDMRPPAAETPRIAGAEIIIHRLRPGETVSGIAGTALVSSALLPDVLALNRITATRALPVGFPLRLRATWLRHDLLTAEVIAFTGPSLVEISGGSTAVALGMNLTEGDRVRTSANGFVTLRLGDGSKVALPSNSNIRIDRLRQLALTGAVDRRFRLDEGGVDTRVAPLKPNGSRFLITTPVSVAAVRGTHFRVTYTPAIMRATTAVLEGRVLVSPLPLDGAAQSFLVTPGFGAVADRMKVSRPVRLLAAPVLDGAAAVQSGPTVEFRLKPLAGAQLYRVEISRDKEGLERIAAQETAELRLSFSGIGNGRHYVHVMAIDEQGLAGIQATQAFDRRNGVATDLVASSGSGGVQELAFGPSDAQPLEEGSTMDDGPASDRFGLDFDLASTELAAEGDAADDGAGGFGGGISGPFGQMAGFGGAGGGGSGGFSGRGDDGDENDNDGGEGGVVPVTPPGNGGSPGGGIGGGGIGGGDTGGGGVIPEPQSPSLPQPPEAGPTTAVPEPATWLMLVAGFGLIGHMVRRRRQLDALHRLRVHD